MGEGNDQYGRPFPSKDKMVPRTAADCIIIRKAKKAGEFDILLITRKKPGPS